MNLSADSDQRLFSKIRGTISEMFEDVSVQSADGGWVLTGGTEAVSISPHSAPSVGAGSRSTSRSARAVCQLWSGLCWRTVSNRQTVVIGDRKGTKVTLACCGPEFDFRVCLEEDLCH